MNIKKAYAMTIERDYLNLLNDILENGDPRVDRTGVGTKALFGTKLVHDLSEGFPLLTTKKLYSKGMIHEMIWFLSGSTNIKYLTDNNVHIWDDWAAKEDIVEVLPYSSTDKILDYRFCRYVPISNKETTDNFYNISYRDTKPDSIEEVFDKNNRLIEYKHTIVKKGDLGPVYGKQWVDWETKDGRHVNQVADLIKNIKENPTSRRLLFTGWNVGELEQMALPPCHHTYQFFVKNNQLSVLLYQRSADAFLGLPWNIAETALLTHMIANVTGLGVGTLTWCGGDTHIYTNHEDAVKEQLTRTPKSFPTLKILRTPETIFDFKYEDFLIEGYESHPAIKADIAV